MLSCRIFKIRVQKRTYSLINKEIPVDVFNEVAYRDTLNGDITYSKIYVDQDDDNKEIIYRYVISRNKYIVNGEKFEEDVSNWKLFVTSAASIGIAFTTIVLFNLTTAGTLMLIFCTWVLLRRLLYNRDIYKIYDNITHTEEEYRTLEDHAKQIILTHQQKNRE